MRLSSLFDKTASKENEDNSVEFHMEFYERLPVVEKCLEKCLIDQNENNNYIHHAPYIWNSIADDHGTPE